ncbi:MAG TPA: hypothetical protein PL155_02895 [Candidatus Omnitrophota bacterium]|nr:hypothetical protein [Candidatus Omnitrophota bacterium]HPD84569.1 hypothetical protein [Candidatus Omnitrophota bacterium]HRZ03427.1 hypothetical protein [Candidatus Omnitrophota bacterium]
MRKTFMIFLGAVLAMTATFALAQTESMTLTTYYPAPLGFYSQLRLVPRDGAALGPPVTCDNASRISALGVMWLDSSLGVDTLKICQDDGTGTLTWVPVGGGGGGSSFWNRTGTNLYPVNIDDNIGIGTNAPATKLHVQGVGDPTVTIEVTGGGMGRPTVQFLGNNGVIAADVGGKVAITNSTAIDVPSDFDENQVQGLTIVGRATPIDENMHLTHSNVRIGRGTLMNGPMILLDSTSSDRTWFIEANKVNGWNGGATTSDLTLGYQMIGGATYNAMHIGGPNRRAVLFGWDSGNPASRSFSGVQSEVTFSPAAALMNSGNARIGVVRSGSRSGGALILESYDATNPALHPQFRIYADEIGQLNFGPAGAISKFDGNVWITNSLNVSGAGMGQQTTLQNTTVNGELTVPFNRWGTDPGAGSNVAIPSSCVRAANSAEQGCQCPDGSYMVGFSITNGTNNGFSIYCRRL